MVGCSGEGIYGSPVALPLTENRIRSNQILAKEGTKADQNAVPVSVDSHQFRFGNLLYSLTVAMLDLPLNDSNHWVLLLPPPPPSLQPRPPPTSSQPATSLMPLLACSLAAFCLLALSFLACGLLFRAEALRRGDRGGAGGAAGGVGVDEDEDEELAGVAAVMQYAMFGTHVAE